MNGRDFTLVGRCAVDESARICSGAVVGKQFRPLLEGVPEEHSESMTHIGADVHLGFYTLVGAGSEIGRGAIVDDYCALEEAVVLGAKTLVIYRAQICNEARVGSHCVIGGLVAERVEIADGVRMFGKIVHSHADPTRGWDNPNAIERSAVIEESAFVGFDALIIGGVVIGAHAYVCAGAIVTRDVPPRHIAFGTNQVIPASQWKGELRRSPIFGMSQ